MFTPFSVEYVKRVQGIQRHHLKIQYNSFLFPNIPFQFHFKYLQYRNNTSSA